MRDVYGGDAVEHDDGDACDDGEDEDYVEELSGGGVCFEDDFEEGFSPAG